MFANAYQGGFLSILFSVGSNPLSIWETEVQNGHIRRITDEEVKSLVLDIGGTNVATTYITCPINPRASLGIRLPFCVMIIKNMQKYFTFEIQILDDKDMRRRFRISNFQSTTKVRPFCTTMPIGLNPGWNQVRFNLADFTKRAYGTIYMETVRVQIHANVRIRRIYFTDQLRNDDDLPDEFKLTSTKPDRKKKLSLKDGIVPVKTSSAKVEVKKSAQKKDIPPPPSLAEVESPRLDEDDREEVEEVEIAETTLEPPAALNENEEGEGGETRPTDVIEVDTVQDEPPPLEEAEEISAKPDEEIALQPTEEEKTVDETIPETNEEVTNPTETVIESEAAPSEPVVTDADD